MIVCKKCLLRSTTKKKYDEDQSSNQYSSNCPLSGLLLELGYAELEIILVRQYRVLITSLSWNSQSLLMWYTRL